MHRVTIEEEVKSDLASLQQEAHDVLVLMACSGRSTKRKLIAEIINLPEQKVTQLLAPLLEKGYVKLSNEVYHFLHDRFREASYQIATSSEQKKFHEKLGRWYLREWPKDSS